jgi:putative flippase GtrA
MLQNKTKLFYFFEIKKYCSFVVIMKRILKITGLFIQRIIDFTYYPFMRVVSKQVYRYGVCGGANVLFDWILYFFVYNFIFKDRLADLGLVTLSPHIASLIIVFPVSTLSGFLLQKYVTFTTSHLKGRTQLMRYLMIVGANLIINYVGLKFFVDLLDIYPTPSKILVTLITTVCSYIGQKRFTFKTQKNTDITKEKSNIK